MSERPPDDPRDPWSDVMRQVDDALSDADLGGGALRESLLQGVRQALDSLEGVLEAEGGTDVDESASVVVMEGGRGEDQPTSDGSPPDLRIADEDPDSPVEDVEAASLAGSEASGVSATVRVIRTGLGAPAGTGALGSVGLQGLGLGQAGYIHISEGAVDDGQTVYRGDDMRSYRLHCDLGRMRILLEGQPVEILEPGQSMDVDGCLIRIQTQTEGGCKGRYIRVEGS